MYKYITVSPRPKPGSRPGVFDWTGSAKWDSWDGIGKKYDGRPQDVELRYIEIARELGYEESLKPSSSQSGGGEVEESPSFEDDIDLDHLDDEVDDRPRQSGKAAGGMGISVSALADRSADEDLDPDHSIHGLARSGNVEELAKLLVPGVNINAPNEDVRLETLYILQWNLNCAF